MNLPFSVYIPPKECINFKISLNMILCGNLFILKLFIIIRLILYERHELMKLLSLHCQWASTDFEFSFFELVNNHFSFWLWFWHQWVSFFQPNNIITTNEILFHNEEWNKILLTILERKGKKSFDYLETKGIIFFWQSWKESNNFLLIILIWTQI